MRLVGVMELSAPDNAVSFDANRSADTPPSSEIVRRVDTTVEVRLPRDSSTMRPDTVVRITAQAYAPGVDARLLVVTVQGSDVEAIRHVLPKPFREQAQPRVDVEIPNDAGTSIRWSPSRLPLERPTLVATAVGISRNDVVRTQHMVKEVLTALHADDATVEHATAEVAAALRLDSAAPAEVVRSPKAVRVLERAALGDALATAVEGIDGATVTYADTSRGLLRRNHELARFDLVTPHSSHEVLVATHARLDLQSVAADVATFAKTYVEHPWVVPTTLVIDGRKGSVPGVGRTTVGKFDEARRLLFVRIDQFDPANGRVNELLADLAEADGCPPHRQPGATTAHELGHVIAASFGALHDAPGMAEGQRIESGRRGLRYETAWEGSGMLAAALMRGLGVPKDVVVEGVSSATSHGAAQEPSMLHLYMPGEWTEYLTHTMGSYAMSNVEEFVVEAYRYATRPRRSVDRTMSDVFASMFQPLDALVRERPDVVPALRSIAAGRLL